MEPPRERSSTFPNTLVRLMKRELMGHSQLWPANLYTYIYIYTFCFWIFSKKILYIYVCLIVYMCVCIYVSMNACVSEKKTRKMTKITRKKPSQIFTYLLHLIWGASRNTRRNTSRSLVVIWFRDKHASLFTFICTPSYSNVCWPYTYVWVGREIEAERDRR